MKYIAIIIILFFIESLDAQNIDEIQSTTKYGIVGGINLNSHTANFTKLPGIPNCCPRYEQGFGIGYNFSLLYEKDVANDIWLGARLGIQTFDGLLSKEETTTVFTPDGVESGVFEHTLDSRFMNVGLEPSIIYNIFDGLFVNLGTRIGYNMTSTFDQVETIIQPDGFGTFIDENGNDTESRTRNAFTGDVPNSVNFQLGIIGGLSYEMPLVSDNTLRLSPEVSYYYALNDFSQDIDWRANSIKMAIAIKYAPLDKKPKVELFKKEYRVDTIIVESDVVNDSTFIIGTNTITQNTVENNTEIIVTETHNRIDTIYTPKSYTLIGKITALGVDDNGNEITNPIFKLEEFVSNRLDPLLNYIFFDDNSSQIPNRYTRIAKENSSQFSLNDLYYESTLEIYHNLMNIVGERLNKNPDASITLIGCNSDLGAEKNNEKLSRNRAESVKQYFVENWSIAPERIKIKNRNLPEKASTPINEPDKIVENRRVEIYSDNDEILAPIFIERIERKANPPIVRFKTEVESEAGLKHWEIEAYQSESKNDNYLQEGYLTDVKAKDWVLADIQRIMPKSPEPIIYSLKLEDKKGNTKIIENKTLPIEIVSIRQKRTQNIGDYEIEKFSLILFDFAKATIEENNMKIIDFIKRRLKPETEVEIIGYTDRTGDAKFNKGLSTQRAEATKKALENNNTIARGLGSEELLYDNDLPEGRFYCRTVNITLKSLIK